VVAFAVDAKAERNNACVAGARASSRRIAVRSFGGIGDGRKSVENVVASLFCLFSHFSLSGYGGIISMV